MTLVTFYDDLIRNYLLFRGFTSTLKAFEAELKIDKDKGFRVDRIVDQLSAYVSSYDLSGLRDIWNHLDQRVFARLEHQYLATVRKLENGLLKMYVVNTLQTNRHDKLHEFYERMGSELQNQPEWKEWFVLPFVKSPEDNPTFAVYFTKQWQDTLFVSLHNFLSVVFQLFKDTPTLFAYEAEQLKMAKLTQENEILKQKLSDILGKDKSTISYSSETDQTTAASSDLMDDFYIIAQEPPPADNQNKTIRSIIRNISSGLPTSPILGRKQPSVATTAAASNQSASVRGKESSDDVTTTTGKFGLYRTKVRTTSLPSSSFTLHRSRPSSESDTSSKQGTTSSQYKEDATVSKTVEATSKMNLQANSSSTFSFLTMDTPRKTNCNDKQSPFLLLSQEEYKEHHSAITHCKFNASGSMIASSDVNGVVKIWSPCPSPQTIATVMSKSSVVALEWANKLEKLLLIGSKTGTIRLYDTKEKKTLCEVGLEPGSLFREQRITCIACNPIETSFVCCALGKSGIPPVPGLDTTLSPSPVGRLMIWDMKSMRLEKTLGLEPFCNVINCCVFNHNGQLLLVGGADGRISLFDMRCCECIAMWQGHQGQAFTVQFSSDETSCYSLGEDGLFIQWNVNKTGQKMCCTTLHDRAAGPFLLPPSMTSSRGSLHRPIGKLFASDSEGKHILTCSPTGGIIYSINNDNPQQLMSLGGHRAPVVTVDWSTAVDCGTCVTASLDGDLHVSTMLAQK